jgi:FixJ family two-component response regulator
MLIVLIAQGLTNRQIAETLIVSERTIDSHVRTILNRLALTSRTDRQLDGTDKCDRTLRSTRLESLSP